jgi:outer membrane protein assembly factor BamA
LNWCSAAVAPFTKLKKLLVNRARRDTMNLLKMRLGVVLFALLVCLLGVSSSAREGTSEPDTACYAAGGIKVEGNRFFGTEELLSEIDLRPNRPYDVNSLERGIDRILTRYEENGFPYCQISPSRFKISERGGLRLSLVVEEGPRVEVKEVQLEGLKTTKRKVILRELGSGLFGFFCESRVNASLRRLSRLSYIKEVEKAELLAGENPEEGIYRITLVERRNNTFSGILGYAPATGNRKGSFFGRMELVFDNIFGTGRMTRWSWSRKDPYSSQFSFLYREPWVFGFPPTLELKISQSPARRDKITFRTAGNTRRESSFLLIFWTGRIIPEKVSTTRRRSTTLTRETFPQLFSIQKRRRRS